MNSKFYAILQCVLVRLHHCLYCHFSYHHILRHLHYCRNHSHPGYLYCRRIFFFLHHNPHYYHGTTPTVIPTPTTRVTFLATRAWNPFAFAPKIASLKSRETNSNDEISRAMTSPRAIEYICELVRWHYGSEQPDVQASDHSNSHKLGSEWVSEGARVSNAEPANEWAVWAIRRVSVQALASRFMVALDHSGSVCAWLPLCVRKLYMRARVYGCDLHWTSYNYGSGNTPFYCPLRMCFTCSDLEPPLNDRPTDRPTD